MKYTLLTALCLMIAFSTSTAHAWGKSGHRVTGAIADHYLSDEARSAIKDLMGIESLAEGSTWADFMRQNPDPFWQREAGPYHYVTIAKDQRYATVGAPPQGDAITGLKKLSAMLTDPSNSQEQRQLALRFIVHIIGDLHQPLHAGNGTDRGGNEFRVVYKNEPTNLHTLWDRLLIDDEELSYTEMTDWLLAKISADQVTEWSVTDPVVWVEESAVLRDGLYPDDQFLSWDYGYQHIGTVRLRLQMGGVRIAAYLNALFEQSL